MTHIEIMNRELSNIINLFRNSEQNLSRLIFDEFNENDDEEVLEEEESTNEEENFLQRSRSISRSNSNFLLTPIRTFDYFNTRTRNTGRNININTNNQRSPRINIERNTQNNDENNSIINEDFTNFMTPVVIRPTIEQINTATVTSSFDLIENPMNNTCPISTVEFRSDDIVSKILYCGHIFLKIELDSWFRSNTRCPMCRYDIRNYRANTQNLI